MSGKKMTTEDELKEIASQLNHPNGIKGIEIGNMMSETNAVMTSSTIDSLLISNNDYVLELGPGNGSHLSQILNKCATVKYVGLEISELMQKEAIKINQNYIDHHQATFYLYNGKIIPFANDTFDKVMTVNTIYFWQNPNEFIKEIYRVTKPNGLVSITFAEENFMKKLPFTKFGFQLYTIEKIEKLIYTTHFKIMNVLSKKEPIKNNLGEFIDRDFVIVTVQK
jgi:ubiquinone/menaquinone biosynthesis C-methylase UbiE